jgi:RND family efflux transporter MFP subunit
MSGVGAPRKRRRWIWWVVLGVVAVAVAAVVLPGLLTPASTTSTVTTGTVERRALTATVSGSGNLAVSSATQVQPGITGTVEDLSIKLGDTVTAGQTLFVLVNGDLDTAVTRAEAAYQQSKQQVQQANINLTKAQNDLYKLQHPSAPATGPVPPVDANAVNLAKQQVTAAQMGVTSAKLDQSSASQALKQAQDDADKRTVTAPVGGLVTVLNAQNGQSLSGGGSSSTSAAGSTSGSTGAVEISDLSTLRARVQVNEVDLVNIKIGQKANISFDSLPDADASGTVSAIAPTGTNTQGVVTYDVDLTLDTIDARLRPSMSCTADIVTETKGAALVVPTSALRTDTSTKKKYVFVVEGQNSARADVTTGLVVGTDTEILTGLTEGQTIVTSPATTSSSSGSGNRSGPGGGMGAMFGGGRD